MKSIKLSSLKLNHFKGIKSLNVEFGEKDIKVYGANASGKTTLFDAFTWLLFNQDSKGDTQFKIKTRGEDGTVRHHLDHEVKGKLIVSDKASGDVNRVNLRKVYKEKWTQNRGSETREFSGHTTDYYIDEVPVKKGEYDGLIDELIDEETFRLITNPLYFSEQLHWKDRREILTEIADNPTREEIAKEEGFEELVDDLEGRDIEDYIKIHRSKMKEINEKLETLPERIDEAARAKPEIDLEENEIAERTAELSEKRSNLEEEISSLRAESEETRLKGEISEVERKLKSIAGSHEAEVKEDIRGLKEEKKDLETGIPEIARGIEKNKAKIEKMEREAANLKDSIEEMEEALEEERSSVFTRDQEECPTCGQELPEDYVEKLRREFNQKKAEGIKSLESELKNEREPRGKLLDEVDNLKAEIEDLKEALEEEREIKEKVDKRIDETRDRLEGYKELEEYEELVKQKEGLKEKLEGESGPDDRVEEKLSELNRVEEKLDSLKEDKSRLKSYRRAEERVEELRKRQEELSRSLEEHERQVYLAEDFNRIRLELVEEEINSMFEMANFELFEEQVNGGVKDICEASYRGVPYEALNGAAKVQVGMDIIKTLQKAYRVSAPVFIDNREGVTEIPELEAQVVSLYVDPGSDGLQFDLTGGVKERVKT